MHLYIPQKHKMSPGPAPQWSSQRGEQQHVINIKKPLSAKAKASGTKGSWHVTLHRQETYDDLLRDTG
jgi:hypothetical protein